MEYTNFRDHHIGGFVFSLPERLEPAQLIGSGVCGAICSAQEKDSHSWVAIKMLNRDNPLIEEISPEVTPEAFEDNQRKYLRQLYRELTIMKYMQHENIVALLGSFIDPQDNIYLVQELMSADLSQVLEARSLTTTHIRYFAYQLLRGLKYMHSAGIVHRDLKPSNIMINEQCDLKIIDFGLARFNPNTLDPGDLSSSREVLFPDSQNPLLMTEYVTTRYYRAPEILFHYPHYCQAADVWSAGCIIAEMIIRQVLFPGGNPIEMVQLWSTLLGPPGDEFLETIGCSNIISYLRSLPLDPGSGHPSLDDMIFPDARAILEKLLVYSPADRITAEDALGDPYFAQFHDPNDEPTAHELRDRWTMHSRHLTCDQWRALISEEVSGPCSSVESSARRARRGLSISRPELLPEALLARDSGWQPAAAAPPPGQPAAPPGPEQHPRPLLADGGGGDPHKRLDSDPLQMGRWSEVVSDDGTLADVSSAGQGGTSSEESMPLGRRSASGATPLPAALLPSRGEGKWKRRAR
ncbi:CMGC/MAPK/P38 protein kinase [Fonticula alba]|uniref:CMGC/MAPK/P38 protein kinase n=1 Tax=Fonticula alba TaxID=691883 RepID=A0A058Z9R6_FONAL|nr:CMGC/MAPK/P38 protein kinase [Fonticula alba]KCV70970.1 CMGC/MAPK/P38 protein kinase [Fonticula alba]|eukprot:XP_009494093.1 CMGC/MAPK/P38 protein kinase [Fonticula alba]